MEGPAVAVVFPELHRRGGIERVCWDLLEYLAPRHATAFVGAGAPDGAPAAVELVSTGGPAAERPWQMYAQRRRIARAVADLGAGVTVTMGSVVSPGDVLWVPSVHRAWLEAARTIQVGRIAVPASVRFLMPVHRVLLAMESQYFRTGSPRQVICTSAREVDDLERLYGVDPSITTVVPNPFDPARFNAGRRRHREAVRADLGVADGELAMVFVANELHRKGLGTTLAAMALAGDERMTLHVVGKAPLGPYRSEVDRLGLAGRVRYHGPSSDVGWVFAGADLLVLPTQYEPFGLVIIEALASGVPVVTSRLAGASEAVRHGSTGLLVDDPYDAEELAALLVMAAGADLERWGRAAAGSVDAYRRDRVLQRVESIIFSEGFGPNSAR